MLHSLSEPWFPRVCVPSPTAVTEVLNGETAKGQQGLERRAHFAWVCARCHRGRSLGGGPWRLGRDSPNGEGVRMGIREQGSCCLASVGQGHAKGPGCSVEAASPIVLGARQARVHRTPRNETHGASVAFSVKQASCCCEPP